MYKVDEQSTLCVNINIKKTCESSIAKHEVYGSSVLLKEIINYIEAFNKNN